MSASDATQLFRDPPDGFVATATGDVAYRTVGSGPDLLLVHGWPLSGATFRLMLPHLIDHATCHIIDLPGTGDSRYNTDVPMSTSGHVQAVRDVVDALGLDEFVVVGSDFGGLLVRHALAGDARVRAMGLIGTEQPQGLNFKFKSFLAMRGLPGFETVIGWVAGKPRLRRNSQLFGELFVDRRLFDGDFESFFLEPLNQDANYRKARIQVLRSFEKADVAALGALHAKVTVPVQLVWGEQDKYFPLKWAEEMVDTFPNASLVTIPDAATFVHEEQPAQVAAALMPLVRGLDEVVE